MENITLTKEELNEFLTVMQEHKEINCEYAYSFKYNEFVIIQVPGIKETGNEFFNFVFTDKEGVIFNLIGENGKLLIDDENCIIAFVFAKSGLKALRKYGELISIDDI